MADNDQPIDAEPAPIREDEKEEKPDLFEDIPEDVRNDSVDSIKTRSRMIDNEIRVGDGLYFLVAQFSHSIDVQIRATPSQS